MVAACEVGPAKVDHRRRMDIDRIDGDDRSENRKLPPKVQNKKKIGAVQRSVMPVERRGSPGKAASP